MLVPGHKAASRAGEKVPLVGRPSRAAGESYGTALSAVQRLSCRFCHVFVGSEAAAGSKSLTEAIGGNLIARAKELTDNGRKALDAISSLSDLMAGNVARAIFLLGRGR